MTRLDRPNRLPLELSNMRPAPLRAVLTTLLTAVLTAVLAVTLAGPWTPASAKNGGNPVTPGNFTGYGFDQCLAPDQAKMNKWLQHSPFLAVGIYISGDSRACRNQPNLTPRWVATQLRKGWRLLPITLGPQASCQPRFPRYKDDFKISPKPGKNGRYPTARKMGRAEARKTVGVAKSLGIVPGSTLWYDLEGFDSGNKNCRESALAFLHAWTAQLHDLNYVSGVYSSAGSGIKALDDARVNRPNAFTLPDRIWIARWDGKANTSTSYIREDGWRPGNRMKQYQGGHDEVWGGVRINIDRNFLALGHTNVAKESHCGGVNVNFRQYQGLHPPANGKTSPKAKVRAMQCLLSKKGLYKGKLNGRYNAATVKAVNAWHAKMNLPSGSRFSRRDWVALHVHGARPVLKFGSRGLYVRRIQRALNAANLDNQLRVSGLFDGATANALRRYQAKVKLPVSGVANTITWNKMRTGKW